MTFAYKLGTRYVTLNPGSTASGKVVWAADIIEKSASVSIDGVATGKNGARGIITATLQGKTAIVELVSIDLAVMDMVLSIPEGGFVYDGTEKEPEVIFDTNEAITLGKD